MKTLSGLYKDWYLEFASYANLDRAVPYITDGLKPVQRRILHSMKEMEDGRYNKIANIVGNTMKYHPHGDTSIGDALVQLGQKDLLIDCQGNWGNIFTGDAAAAPRYIEARLSKFALDVVYNQKITEWMPSYDGRNQEPVCLPVKFPLLLAQGAEGIGVGMSAKILPHNFNELIEASIACLKEETFTLYPDFPTGGYADCSKYNNGTRGGRVLVRARIEKRDKRTLAITEIPFGSTTQSVIASILTANEKGKIKIKKVDDITAAKVEILIHLAGDVSPDKTIDALYAFTECQKSIAPNALVIEDQKPVVLPVEDILRHNTFRTRDLLRQELEIRLEELERDWHFSSLEKIFFEERIYRELEKEAKTWERQLQDVFTALQAFQDRLRRPVTREDVDRLVEKPVRKISKFDIKKAEEHLRDVEKERAAVAYDLDHITEYAIKFYQGLKDKYGSAHPRLTELTDFETIEAKKVAIANAKLYVNRTEGFVGYGLRNSDREAEYLCDCSDIDDVLVVLKDGKYRVTKIKEKDYVGKNILYAGIFKSGDKRTTYNIAYRHGKQGYVYVKRCLIDSIAKEKEYDFTQGAEGSQLLWFTINANGETDVIKVFLRLQAKVRKPIFEYDFADLSIKGRTVRGNLLSKHPVQKITLKEKGEATMGGQQIWFDADIQRLNTDERGLLLGEFQGEDRVLALNKNGTFYTTDFDLSNRYQDELALICKFRDDQVFSVLYFDGESQSHYLKRCTFEPSDDKPLPFISEASGSYLIAVSTSRHPQVQIVFGGKHAHRPELLLDAADFIGAKSFRAKGKRATSFEVAQIVFLDQPEEEEETSQDCHQDKESDSHENAQRALEAEMGFALDGDPERIPDGTAPATSPARQNTSPSQHHDEDAIQIDLF